MGIERVEETTKVPDFSAICPDCKGNTTHIHDLRCTVCDNKKIVWCPRCKLHFKVQF
jgi:hypothetical protein